MSLDNQLKDFLKKAKKPLLVILGPTASGKTALSLKIAHQISGEIISTDSRQIYRELDIGTDCLLPEEQEGIPHHLLRITAPDKAISAAEYKEEALKAIKDIYKRGKIPMLVGGTGLYISSIIKNYDIPRIPPNEKLRKQLEEEAAKFGNERLHQKLEDLDPLAAAEIHPNNLRYLIRALEINMESGKNKPHKSAKADFDTFLVGIKRTREELYQRINARADRQVARGLLEEVKVLLDKGYDENLPAMTSLGVKEVIPYIKGEESLAECLRILKRNTRRYAKRQMTWFKRYDNVTWLSPADVKNYLQTPEAS